MNPLPVKIYSKDDVPRLRYIAGIILGDILGLEWEVITDKRKLGKHPVINYSNEHINGALRITPVTILFETGITPKEILVSEWKGVPIFFQTSPDSDIPFDIFAASFFLVSRYEEYLEYEPDEYGRFKSASSVAYKNGFLGKPVVDIWVKEMAIAFLKKFNYLVFRRNDYKALLTIDIDQPFAYLGKNLLRSLGGMINDIKSNSGTVGNRYRIVTKGEKDPYDVFDYITENIEKIGTEAKFFIPVGDHSKFDKNPSWKNEEYRKLIYRVSDKFQCGLHPSYFAAGNYSLLNTEMYRLRTILGKQIRFSRFHYIKLLMPRSYRDISNAGIIEDYSMGYPDEPGFRAGIARPYYFYDVSEDVLTGLKIIPFQMMDATFYQYRNLDPDLSRQIILNIIDETKKAGGLFTSIWHNTSLLDNTECKGWREVFEFMLKNQVL